MTMKYGERDNLLIFIKNFKLLFIKKPKLVLGSLSIYIYTFYLYTIQMTGLDDLDLKWGRYPNEQKTGI